MYFYIYDSFLNNKKYEVVLTKIEARLLDLGISGRTEKITILKNLKEIVEEAINKKGAKTIVAVGNNQLVSKIISILAKYNNIVLGIIPIGEGNHIADILGVPHEEEACDVLSRRVIEKVDLGKINQQYFFSCIEVPKATVVMECDGSYQVIPLDLNHKIRVCNISRSLNSKDLSFGVRSNPQDGILEAVVFPQSPWLNFLRIFKKEKEFKPESVFPIKKVKIKSQQDSIPIVADGDIVVKTPVMVEVAPQRLKVIVGRNRKF